MITAEFETTLANKGCYFIRPSLFVPGSNETADYISPEDILLVFEKDGDKLSKCIRRRSEQSNAMTYYARNLWGNGYFRTVVPTGTGAIPIIDMVAVRFQVQQFFDTWAMRLGFA